MQDLNDLHYFVRVVDHGGFAPAARATGLQKSKLSRRIAALESRLGVRLLNRSSRRFSVTEVGQEFYRHCVAMLVEAEAAEQAIAELHAEPRGRSAEHTSELQSLMRISYAVFRLHKKQIPKRSTSICTQQR